MATFILESAVFINIQIDIFNCFIFQKGKCRYSVKGKAGYCSNFYILPQGDEETLKAAVASVGPVAVAVNAMLSSFHLYRGGEATEYKGL